MSWAAHDLTEIDAAHEIRLVMHRAERPELRVPVWPIVAGGQLFVRSWAGAESKWFRRALADAAQAIEVGGRDIPVTFEPVADHAELAIADGYRAKYGRGGDSYIGAMIAPKAVEATVRLIPRAEEMTDDQLSSGSLPDQRMPR
ncbi:DUF2255 family protein [soil metagenome]